MQVATLEKSEKSLLGYHFELHDLQDGRFWVATFEHGRFWSATEAVKDKTRAERKLKGMACKLELTKCYEIKSI